MHYFINPPKKIANLIHKCKNFTLNRWRSVPTLASQHPGCGVPTADCIKLSYTLLNTGADPAS